MGIISYNSLKNNASQGRKRIDGSSINNLADAKLYRNDTQTIQDFPNNVGATNPIYFNLGGAGNKNWENGVDRSQHAQPFVNKYKVCDLYYTTGGLGGSKGPGDSRDPSQWSWGNWRTQSGIPVSDQVYLWMENPQLAFSYTHDYTPAYEAVMEKSLLGKLKGLGEGLRVGGAAVNGVINAFSSSAATPSVDLTSGEVLNQPNDRSFLNTVSGAIAKGLRGAADGLKEGYGETPFGGRFMSTYSKIPAWNNTSPMSIPSLKFTFQFGQFGFWSGEHEVVRPVIALASLFTVDSVPGFPNYMIGPAPTVPLYLVQLGVKLAEKAANIVDNMTSGSPSSQTTTGSGRTAWLKTVTSSAGNGIAKLEQGIYSVVEDTVTSIPGVRQLWCRIGRMTFGPMIAKTVSWAFDFNQTDEYGFPTKGSIEFQVEGINYPTNDFVNMWDYTPPDFT